MWGKDKSEKNQPKIRFVDILVISIISVILILMPIQTPLMTFLIQRNGFPSWITSWKEVLSVFLFFLLWFDIIRIVIQKNIYRYNEKIITYFWRPIVLSVAILWILNVSLINNITLPGILYGFRFELWWVVLLVSVFCWKQIHDIELGSEVKEKLFFRKILENSVYIGFFLVSLLSLISLLTSEAEALTPLGYGELFRSSTFLSPPVCQRVDAFDDRCRLSGGYSLPNHFAGYLLLVIPVFASTLLRSIEGWIETNQKRLSLLGIFVSSTCLILANLFIYLSFTRFAWLGLLMIAGYIVWYAVSLKLISLNLPSWSPAAQKLYGIGVWFLIISTASVGIIGINLPPEFLDTLPVSIAKPASTNEHYRHTMANFEILQQDIPRLFSGYGLGSSGPAAQPFYVNPQDNPIFQRYEYIAVNWLLNGDDLLIPENWFIQLVLNGGILYALGYCLILFSIIASFSKGSDFQTKNHFNVRLFQLSMISIAIGNLFLHIWENQTVALYFAFLPLLILDE